MHQYAQSANVQNYVDAPPKPSGLETIHNRLRASIDQADTLVNSPAMLEGRLMGGVAGGKAELSARPQPSGHIGAIGVSLDDLGERLDRCHQIAQRLSEAI